MSARPKPAPLPTLRPMEPADVEAVHEIEVLSYRNPWPVSLFRQEVSTKGYSHPIVAELDGTVVGYAVTWVVLDEVHLMNIAVHPVMRRRGVGHGLMRRVIRMALDHRCRWITLEVRVSNEIARRFYRSYSFREVGRRKKYYSDNDEDAVLMALDLRAQGWVTESDQDR